MGKYKRRKDGRLSAQVVVGYSEDKKIIKTVYGKTDKEVDDQLLDIRYQLKRGIYVNASISLAEWAQEWLKLYKSAKEFNTYKMYQSMVETNIVPNIGHIKLTELRTHHLQGLINTFLDKDMVRAAEICAMTLKQILKQAILNEYAYKNVAEGISLPTKRKPEKRALTENEKKLILNVEYTDMEKAYIYLLYYTGMRRCEILALSKGNIDFKNNIIQVRQNVIFKDGNKSEVKDYLKTKAGKRDIPLLPKLTEVLKPYYDSLPGLGLFSINDVYPFTKSQFARFWEKIIRKINFAAGGTKDIDAISSDITPHIFRHNFATILYNAEIDLKSAMRIMGHGDMKILLEVYTHLDNKKDQKSYNKLVEFTGNM
ncbi:MAG: tyrosine-type recombinase/integrase [Bacillota bacterium]